MKRSIKVVLSCIPLIAVPITHISGISKENISKESLNENNYKKIANQVKNKINVKDWINEVNSNRFQNYEKDVKSLYNLNLTNIQKEFLKQNLKEKYQIRSMNKRNNRIRRAAKSMTGVAMYLIGEGGGAVSSSVNYLKFPGSKVEAIDLSGSKIPFKGPVYSKPSWQTKDFPIRDDVSFLNWNNKTILKKMIFSGMKKINYNEKLQKIQNDIVFYNKVIQDHFKLKAMGRAGPGWSSRLNYLRVAFRDILEPEPMRSEWNGWSSRLNYLKKEFVQNGDYIQYKKREIQSLLAKLSNYVGINFKKIIDNKSINEFIKKSENNSQKNGNAQFTNLLVKTLGRGLAAAAVSGGKLSVVKEAVSFIKSPSSKAAGRGMIIALLVYIVGSIIIDKVIGTSPAGNGYTVAENWHDHGLNDWRFQTKNNFETMVKIAHEWSNNYQHPITWKVTDGWFTKPTLKISRGTIRYKNDHNGNWTKLTPFHSGRKTYFRKYST